MLNQKSFEYILDLLNLLSKFELSKETCWIIFRTIKNMYKSGVKEKCLL